MKNFFILLLFTFFLIQISYADSFTVNVPDTHGGYAPVLIQSSGSGYTGPDGEYYANFPTVQQLQLKYGFHSAAEQQQVIDQQIKQSEQKMDATQKQWQADAKKQQDEALFKSAHPFGIPTPAEKKKDARDWAIADVFMWTLLLIALGGLVLVLLHFVPNRFINADQGQGLSALVAVRRGMTQANFNASNSKFLMGEVFVVAIFVGVGFKSFLAFLVAFVGLIILLMIPMAGFIVIYLFSVFWMLCGGQFGYLICGGQFASMGSYAAAWIGGIICAALGFTAAMGSHFAALQYLGDIGNR